MIVGLLGALYGGLGVGQALQNAMDSVWAVPKHKRPNPIRSRLRSLLLLLVLGSAAIAATVLAAVGHAAGAVGILETTRPRARRRRDQRVDLPGGFSRDNRAGTDVPAGVARAVAAAFIWQMLQWFGAGYVAHTVKRASATNSVFALVLGALAFLFLASVALVLCAEVNVVLVEKLYPRALLSAFSDDADLTPADRRTYTKKVKAERVKAFERVSVRFDDVRRLSAKAVGRPGVSDDSRRSRTP